MQVEFLTIPGLQPTRGAAHVARVRGGETLYLSGQGGYDDNGGIVADHYAQSVQAFANIGRALAAVGADYSAVVKATYYIVGLNNDSLAAFSKALREVPGYDPDNPPASTMIGVECLAFDEMLVEYDVTAVIDPEAGSAG